MAKNFDAAWHGWNFGNVFFGDRRTVCRFQVAEFGTVLRLLGPGADGALCALRVEPRTTRPASGFFRCEGSFLRESGFVCEAPTNLVSSMIIPLCGISSSIPSWNNMRTKSLGGVKCVAWNVTRERHTDRGVAFCLTKNDVFDPRSNGEVFRT